MPEDDDDGSPQIRALPLLILKDNVVFPGTTQSFTIEEPESIQALERAMRGPQTVVTAGQKSPEIEHPTPADIHQVGTVCRILQLIDYEDAPSRLTLEGLYTVKLKKFFPAGSGFEVRIKNLEEKRSRGKTIDNLNEHMLGLFEATIQSEQTDLFRFIPPEGEEYTPETLLQIIEEYFQGDSEALQFFRSAVDSDDRWMRIGEYLQQQLVKIRPSRFVDDDGNPSFSAALSEGAPRDLIENLFVTLLKEISEYIAEPLEEARSVESPGERAHYIASSLPISVDLKQKILQLQDVEARIRYVCSCFEPQRP